MFEDPVIAGEDVVDGGWEMVLGGEAVAEADDGCIGG